MRANAKHAPNTRRIWRKTSHTVEFTKDGDPVSVTLMNCREYENTYEADFADEGGYKEISNVADFCCQVEVNTTLNSGRLCVPWTYQERNHLDFKLSQSNLCRFFGVWWKIHSATR